MPRYFFDVDDGELFTPDITGDEMQSPEDARAEAIGLLPDIARGLLPDGDERVFSSTVRDESGKAIYQATLSLTCTKLK